MKKYRSIQFYKTYFEDFFETLSPKVRDKFIWTFQLIEEVDKVPKTYLKHIKNDLYEVRVKFGSNIFRAFAFFDGNKLIIIINGYQKKTQKAPKNEILKALKIKKQYDDENTKN